MGMLNFNRVWPSEVINTKNHWAVGVQWPIVSSRTGEVYQVEMHDRGFDCTCPAFKGKCKHIKYVEKRFCQDPE
jgi:hypothetical protein